MRPASNRFVTSSLRSRFDTWTLTVFSLMNREAAIALFVAPVERRSRTSRSRGVNRLNGPSRTAELSLDLSADPNLVVS